MSIDMIKSVKDSKFKSSGQKFVMFCLADYADEDGKCWPSVALICNYTGQAEKTVRTHLSDLEECGAIVRKRQRRQDGTLGRYNFFIQSNNLPSSGQNSQLADLARTSGQKGKKPVAKSTAHCNQLTPNEPPKEKNTKKESEEFIALAKVLEPEKAKEIIKFRKLIKKPLTKSSATLLAGKFEKSGSPNEAADVMLLCGWQGFEPTWDWKSKLPKYQQSKPKVERTVFGDIPDNTFMSPEEIQRKAGMIA